MKAMIITDVNKYGIKEISVPKISSREVLVKMRACGICHSDYELISGKYIIPFNYPIIPGHEWSGEIVEIGSEVKNFKVGDRVVGECVLGCGVCPVCQSGNFNFCPSADHFGFSINGADAEYFKVNPLLLHKIPDEMTFQTASMIEPFSVAYYGIYGIGGVDASDVTLIQGGGAIGLCSLVVAKAMGSKVILVDPHEDRREIGKKLGADFTINPRAEDVNTNEVVNDLTNGFGVDLVVLAAGSNMAFKQSFDFVKNGGRISYVGINIKNEIPVELGMIQIKGITVKGMVGSPYVWEKVIDFITQSNVDLSPIMTHQFPLEEAEIAFSYPLNSYKYKSVKVTLTND